MNEITKKAIGPLLGQAAMFLVFVVGLCWSTGESLSQTLTACGVIVLAHALCMPLAVHLAHRKEARETEWFNHVMLKRQQVRERAAALLGNNSETPR